MPQRSDAMGAKGVAWVVGAVCVMGCASKKATEQPGAVKDGRLGAGLHERELESAGVTRRYDVFVPKEALPGPSPLLVVMHGGGGGAENGRVSTKMAETADALGFVVVFPQGTPGPRARPRRPLATWNASPECCGAASESGVDDVSFIREVVGDVSARVAVDAARVYATGHSNGGLMALRLGCEASDVFAAVAAVGAPGSDWSSCEVARPAPVLVVHGEKDRCASFEGGQCGGCFERVFATLTGREIEAKTWSCPSVRESIAPWRTRAGLEDAPAVQAHEGGASCEVWAKEGAEVALCVDPSLGHAWPDGAPNDVCARRPGGRFCEAWMAEIGPRSASFDNGLQWRFFARHALPR